MALDNKTAKIIEKLFQLKERVNILTDVPAAISVKLHDELECLIVSGFYLGPLNNLSSKDNKSRIVHYWGYHPELESFMDITASDYHQSNPPLLLIPQDDKRIIYPNERRYPESILEVSEIYILGGLVHRRFLPNGEQLPARYLEYLRTNPSSLPRAGGRELRVSV